MPVKNPRTIKRPKPRHKFDILEDGNAVDRAIIPTLRAMRDEALRIEDKDTREEWLDALQTFARTGDIETLLTVTEWRRKVVDMDTFLFDPMYLGLEEGSVYPRMRETLNNIDVGNYNEAIFMGAIGIGKSLDVNTLIPTKHGWKSMGNIVAGDILFDEKGNYTTVTAAHPVRLNRKCYEIEFTDGDRIVCDEEHLWYTETKTPHGNRVGSVKDTKAIHRSVMNGKELNHRIPVTRPLMGEDKEFTIDPYTLGAWLGDGASHNAILYCHDKDRFIVNRIKLSGHKLHLIKQDTEKCPGYRLWVSHDGYDFNFLLRELGILNNKRIPQAYLRGSFLQRQELMQGLMDTDGTIGKSTGVCEWVTKSEFLKDDFLELTHSLGLKPTWREKAINGRTYYRVTFTAYRDVVDVFSLPRKQQLCRYSGAQADRQRSRYIKAVRKVVSRPVRCISVDSPSRLFLAGEGMIPTHNTFGANIGLIRDIYKLSCMRNPQTSFGIQAKSYITLTVQSVRFSTAKIAIFNEIGALLSGSRYFREVFPLNNKIQSRLEWTDHKIQLMPATSSTTGILSMNVIAGLLDEANFMQKIKKSKSQFADEGEYDQARNLFNILAGRRKSRFNRRNNLPGHMYLASSSRYPTDFTEERAKMAEMCGGNDPTIYVHNYSQWEGKPRSNFKKEEFRVQIGNEHARSRVLEEGEVAHPGCEVLSVPVDFKPDFERDCDKAIQDFAGKPILSINPFIARRETIEEAHELHRKYGYTNLYNLQECELTNTHSVPAPMKSHARKDVPSFRVAHLDLAVSKDACGIAIGHVAGYKVMPRMIEGTDIPTLDVLPVIAIDATMRVVPPKNGEITFERVREFLVKFREESGLDLRYVTSDGFQSVDMRQILRSLGFLTDYQSVEKIEPYRTLRDTMYDGRLLLPEHAHLDKELRELETHYHNNKEKADHPEHGSKDVADAVCGVVNFLATRRSTWTGVVLDRGPGYHMLGRSNEYATLGGIAAIMSKPDETETLVQDVLKTARRHARKVTSRKSTIRRPIARK